MIVRFVPPQYKRISCTLVNSSESSWFPIMNWIDLINLSLILCDTSMIIKGMDAMIWIEYTDVADLEWCVLLWLCSGSGVFLLNIYRSLLLLPVLMFVSKTPTHTVHTHKCIWSLLCASSLGPSLSHTWLWYCLHGGMKFSTSSRIQQLMDGLRLD